MPYISETEQQNYFEMAEAVETKTTKIRDLTIARGEDEKRIATLEAEKARLTATNDRQSLMIYAKDRQIAELTRMLFALGKQDGQTIRELKQELAERIEEDATRARES